MLCDTSEPANDMVPTLFTHVSRYVCTYFYQEPRAFAPVTLSAKQHSEVLWQDLQFSAECTGCKCESCSWMETLISQVLSFLIVLWMPLSLGPSTEAGQFLDHVVPWVWLDPLWPMVTHGDPWSSRERFMQFSEKSAALRRSRTVALLLLSSLTIVYLKLGNRKRSEGLGRAGKGWEVLGRAGKGWEGLMLRWMMNAWRRMFQNRVWTPDSHSGSWDPSRYSARKWKGRKTRQPRPQSEVRWSW